ncbi:MULTISPECIES: MarR family winged helix-turn-helix transcriptional regulator [Bacillus]|uniref:MarR family winged helix-turn-helix transcriptional regulator n=1 Tax=Bacillus TaxID=1386 RepID=UPI000B9A37FE|nr:MULTISPECIES: MarR family transcriptional regulator [Bacillus]OXT19473.1 MarR family transcriptional regulator [Bacillus sp. OG2]MCA1036974.1 MarR family transcriptional regulator [Bacillus infantis]MCK6204810.1 MarR family transcriptional regulator [Bacillus infantis]MDT0160557.1 MarR family transcriptional regulator [Bacillus sp. AG4(2022)]RYI31108.1 MarR family transcriptional regulator [Bacillus infantis]
MKQAAELERAFRTVFRTLRQEVNKLMGDEVTSNEFTVLKLIADGPKMASAISKELNVSASHITSVTDSLVRKGYMTRSRSENDRRVVELVLTGTGKELVEKLEEKKSAYLQAKFRSFTEEELDQLVKLFQKLM